MTRMEDFRGGFRIFIPIREIREIRGLPSGESGDHLSMEIDHPARPHVVIIGAGFGGLDAAKHLGDKPGRVTVMDRTNYPLSPPRPYQWATAAPPPAATPGRLAARPSPSRQT